MKWYGTTIHSGIIKESKSRKPVFKNFIIAFQVRKTYLNFNGNSIPLCKISEANELEKLKSASLKGWGSISMEKFRQSTINCI